MHPPSFFMKKSPTNFCQYKTESTKCLNPLQSNCQQRIMDTFWTEHCSKITIHLCSPENTTTETFGHTTHHHITYSSTHKILRKLLCTYYKCWYLWLLKFLLSYRNSEVLADSKIPTLCLEHFILCNIPILLGTAVSNKADKTFHDCKPIYRWRLSLLRQI
jgi:hypothetical protein